MAISEAPARGEGDAMENAVAKLRGGILLPRYNRRGSYEVWTFSEGDFWNNKDPLTDIVVEFAQRELGWTEETARATYERSLKVDDRRNEALIPSVLLFRRRGVVMGVSAQRMRVIGTQVAGDVPVEFHILRAFEKDARTKHMGRDSIDLGRYTHRKALYYVARNTGPVPVYATMEAGKERGINNSTTFVEGTFHPWDRLYDQDSSDRVSQEIMIETHLSLRRDESGFVNSSTSVSKKDLKEFNKSYRPRPGHTPTENLLDRMEGEFEMDIEEGDSVITVARFRR